MAVTRPSPAARGLHPPLSCGPIPEYECGAWQGTSWEQCMGQPGGQPGLSNVPAPPMCVWAGLCACGARLAAGHGRAGLRAGAGAAGEALRCNPPPPLFPFHPTPVTTPSLFHVVSDPLAKKGNLHLSGNLWECTTAVARLPHSVVFIIVATREFHKMLRIISDVPSPWLSPGA